MLLNNTLFDVDTLLRELQQGPKGEKSALEILQIKLKTHYFDKNTSNEDVLEKLKNPGFTDFPRLKHVLHEIFSGHANFEIPEDSKDWEPRVTFEQLNNQYGYFNQDLSTLFQQLAVACKKMTSLIERQAHDDEMAYKLMALFYDPSMSPEKNFEQISKKFDKLITTKQDKTIATPYHDAFVTSLHHFPRFDEVKEFDTWKAFITKEGFKSLDIFAQCATEQPAFKDTQEAQSFLLQQKYPRAQENPTLAQLCKALLISNDGFNAGLPEASSGWPKKESDNLPIVDIQDHTGQFFWVKLPPQDMRALYLGNLIPDCCQHIGGHSEQCVKDGIRLSDNGFYVLLKSKRAQANSNRIIDHQINDKDYDIVAQSYAWKTTNGNLCLDSIEWNKLRVSKDVIQDLMTTFSEQVFAEHPDIKHINVGKGGQTPENVYPHSPINETMKQGYLYIDAREQYQIASNMPNDVLSALKERLKDVPVHLQGTILYLAPYIQDIENVPGQLMSVLDELPQLIAKINLPPKLSTDDFKKISYEEYQIMEPSQQSSISTICKLFNSPNEADLKKWLPTIPNEELVCIPLVKNQYSLEFKVAVLQRLPQEQRLATLLELDASYTSILTQSVEHPQLFKMILALYPTDEARLDAVQGPLMRAVSKSESLKMILELIPENQRLAAVTEKGTNGKSIIDEASSSNLYSLEIILELIPENQRLAAVTEKGTSGKSILDEASSSNLEKLQIILELIPENQRLAAVTEKGTSGKSILDEASSSNLEKLQMILELLPRNHHFDALKDIKGWRYMLLASDSTNPKILQMILDIFPTNKERLDAINEKDNREKTTLMYSTSNAENLKVILDLIPESQRFEAVTDKNNNGVSTLMSAAYNPETLKIVLERLPETQCLDAIKEKDNREKSTLMYAASNPESLKMILERLPETQRLDAIKEKDNREKSTLMYAASNPESLKMIFERLPETQRLKAITEKDQDGKLTLMYAASNPENLKMILELYPTNKDRLDAINEKDKEKKSTLMYATSNPESLKVILEHLPETQRLKAITEKDQDGKSTLTYASSNPDSLKILLEIFPETQRFALVNKMGPFKGQHRTTLLTDAISNHEQMKIILETLPETRRLEAVKQKDKHGKSTLMYAVSNHEHLRNILKLLPKNQLLDAVKEKDNSEKSILMYASSNFESLKIILEMIPENQRLDALKEKDNSGKSILMHAFSNPESIQFILKCIPNDQLFNAITERDKAKKPMLLYAAYEPESLKILLDPLPENQRLDALKEKDVHNKSTLMYASLNSESLCIILESLPKDMSFVIENCVKKIERRELDKLTFSMLDFMTNIKGLATPMTINHFVHAVLNNQDVEPALNALLTPPSSNSFFKSNSNEAIQECISKLDNYWLTRIPKVELVSQITEAPHQQKKQ